MPFTHRRCEIRRTIEWCESGAKDPADHPCASLQRLETPASKGWRGFDEESSAPRRAAPTMTPSGASRGKAWLTETTGSESVTPKSSQPALRFGSKVSVFGTLATVRDQRDAASLQAFPSEKPARRQARSVARKRVQQRASHFTYRSENAHDSCLRARRANGHDRSRSRRFSDCDTWRPTPTPLCAPACAGS